MDIKDYFRILWRRKWIVLATTIAAVLVAIVGTSLIQPIYQASTTLRVAASAGGSLNYNVTTYQLINTTAQIAASQTVREDLMKSLGLNEKPVVTSEVISSTELIKITVDYPDPKMAAQIANTLAEMIIAQSNELYTGGKISSQDVLAEQISQYRDDLEKTRREYEALLVLTPPAPERASLTLDLLQLKQRNYEELLRQYDNALLQQQVRANMITVVEKAVAPRAPSQPRAAYNYLLGVVVGLLGGIVLGFMAESFDSTLYSEQDIETATTLPILAKIPKASQNEVCMSADDTSSLAEAFRNLALNIMMLVPQKSKNIVVIMSAEPQQGKSTMVHNLAVALAEYGKKAVAVDCDMRLPKLHELFNIPNQTGLKDMLEEKDSAENLLANPSPCVTVLSSGSQPVNPSQLLGSPQMANVLKDLRQQFDYVLLDTPALLAVSDTMAIIENTEIVKNVDAFIMVVRQSYAKRDSVKAVSTFLRGFSNKFARVVINYSNDATSYQYYRTGQHKVKRLFVPKIVKAEK